MSHCHISRYNAFTPIKTESLFFKFFLFCFSSGNKITILVAGVPFMNLWMVWVLLWEIPSRCFKKCNPALTGVSCQKLCCFTNTVYFIQQSCEETIELNSHLSPRSSLPLPPCAVLPWLPGTPHLPLPPSSLWLLLNPGRLMSPGARASSLPCLCSLLKPKISSLLGKFPTDTFTLLTTDSQALLPCACLYSEVTANASWTSPKLFLLLRASFPSQEMAAPSSHGLSLKTGSITVPVWSPLLLDSHLICCNHTEFSLALTRQLPISKISTNVLRHT